MLPFAFKLFTHPRENGSNLGSARVLVRFDQQYTQYKRHLPRTLNNGLLLKTEVDFVKTWTAAAIGLTQDNPIGSLELTHMTDGSLVLTTGLQEFKPCPIWGPMGDAIRTNCRP